MSYQLSGMSESTRSLIRRQKSIRDGVERSTTTSHTNSREKGLTLYSGLFCTDFTHSMKASYAK